LIRESEDLPELRHYPRGQDGGDPADELGLSRIDFISVRDFFCGELLNKAVAEIITEVT